MKSLLLLAAISPLALSAQAAFADDPVPNPLVPVRAENVFIPDGFDDNDETQVVLDGYLPDTCYRLSHVSSRLDQTTGQIAVTQYARKFSALCLPALVPYTSEVALGVLPMGQYSVNSRGVPNGGFHVKEASSAGPDDFFYAPVDSASVRYDEVQKAYVATIRGRLTSRCMEWENVQVLDQGKVKVVLPILKTTDAEQVCEHSESSFEREVTLPAAAPGRYLLHVRSLNGKAVNTVFSVD